jgi:hypothetical protein
MEDPDFQKSVDKVRYRVAKISEDLEQLPIEEHRTIIAVLGQYFEVRTVKFRKEKEAATQAQQAGVQKLMEDQRLEKKFIPTGAQ